MKRLLIGLLALGSITAVAQDKTLDAYVIKAQKTAEIHGAQIINVESVVRIAKELNEQDLKINGLPISARLHWNSAANVADVVCAQRGFRTAIDSKTITENTEPQSMNFIVGHVSKGYITKVENNENIKLVSITCTKVVKVNVDEQI